MSKTSSFNPREHVVLDSATKSTPSGGRHRFVLFFRCGGRYKGCLNIDEKGETIRVSKIVFKWKNFCRDLDRHGHRDCTEDANTNTREIIYYGLCARCFRDDFGAELAKDKLDDGTWKRIKIPRVLLQFEAGYPFPKEEAEYVHFFEVSAPS